MAMTASAIWQPQEDGLREICGLLRQHISPTSNKPQIWQQLQHSQFPNFDNYLIFILAREKDLMMFDENEKLLSRNPPNIHHVNNTSMELRCGVNGTESDIVQACQRADEDQANYFGNLQKGVLPETLDRLPTGMQATTLLELMTIRAFHSQILRRYSLLLSLVYNHTKGKHAKPPISYISQPPSPSPDAYNPRLRPTNVYNIRSFGAVGDGVTDDTQAFKMAWDTICQVQTESVTLIIPQHYSFMIQSTIFTGPCRNNMVFQVEGTLMPPNGLGSWLKNLSKHQWLVFYRIHGMSFQGGGLIDGKGEKWWNLPCKPHKGINGKTLPGPCDSPVAMRFFQSSNLTVQGLKIQNSPQFHFRFDKCKNVYLDSITIKSPL